MPAWTGTGCEMHVFTLRITRCFAALGLIVALIGAAVPATFADGGSNVAGSPFNGHDGVIDGNALLTATDQPSGQTDNAFGQGAKEDQTVVNVVTGSIPPNKNDLATLYVTGAVGQNSHVYLYLAWQRAVNIGSANLDIELNQNSFGLPLTDAKNVVLNRAANDLLVLYDFQGSGTPGLSLFTWITSGGPCAVSQDSAPCWKSLGSANATSSEAAVSGDGLTGEAVIDLTAQGLIPNNQCESFAQGWDKARSSTSLTAELKDFISPGPAHFNTCGALKVTKQSIKGNAPLAGATFSITGPNSFSTTVTTGSDGTACVGGLVQGSYTVTETAAPGGYSIDNPSPVSVTIDHTADCAGSTGTPNAPASAFKDTPLSQIEVKFTSLAGPGVTAASIACANGGTTVNAVSENGTAEPAFDDTDETFTNLVPGTYICTVVVDP
jgi:hypothetical protein